MNDPLLTRARTELKKHKALYERWQKVVRQLESIEREEKNGFSRLKTGPIIGPALKIILKESPINIDHLRNCLRHGGMDLPHKKVQRAISKWNKTHRQLKIEGRGESIVYSLVEELDIFLLKFIVGADPYTIIPIKKQEDLLDVLDD